METLPTHGRAVEGSPRSAGPGRSSPGTGSPGTGVAEEVETHQRLLPPYHVILLDDDDHTFDYVIEMLRAIFGFPPERGFRHADQVNRTGRSILITTTKEHAELKQEQIHSYGRDPRLVRSKGSMTAIIEPAE